MLHLLNQGEVGEVLGVSRPRVARIIDTHRTFPKPYAFTLVGDRQMKLWREADIAKWVTTWDRQPGRRAAA